MLESNGTIMEVQLTNIFESQVTLNGELKIRGALGIVAMQLLALIDP